MSFNLINHAYKTDKYNAALKSNIISHNIHRNNDNQFYNNSTRLLYNKL